MELIIIWSLIFIISVCALIKASDWLVLGLRRVVPLFGMRESDIALPAALIAVALPEMGVALAAALEGKAEVAIAVVIGSSIANILLVTGLAAFSAGPLLLKKNIPRSICRFSSPVWQSFSWRLSMAGSMRSKEY